MIPPCTCKTHIPVVNLFWYGDMITRRVFPNWVPEVPNPMIDHHVPQKMAIEKGHTPFLLLKSQSFWFQSPFCWLYPLSEALFGCFRQGLVIGPQCNVCARMGNASFGLMKAPLLVVLHQQQRG